ncbi:MAG: hypothetical protein HYV93_11925 [Candidatus Rokubacteria bacterium]|nr:hypothetical protein [Candidatus Rokubacteria bacterium]
MHSDITPRIGGASGRRHALRAAALLFTAAALVHVAALAGLGAGPDAVAGLMVVDLLILAGSTAAASLITRALPEEEVPAFWGAGFVGMFLFGMLFLATWAVVFRRT